MVSLSTWAKQLGGDVHNGSILCPGPNHKSPLDRSMCVTPCPKRGFIVHSFAGDDWRDCREYVAARLGIDANQPFTPCGLTPAEKADEAAKKARRIDGALKIWREATDARGTATERYLLNHRGLHLPDDAYNVVRHYSRCPFGEGTQLPCMIVLKRDILTGEPQAIERTALAPDCSKIDRKSLGPIGGTAVMLGQPGDTLTIGEGFETCLSSHQLGQRPVWSLGSAGEIERFPIIPGVDTLVILLEHDATNAKKSEICADRWMEAGCGVVGRLPKFGNDMNDALRSAREVHQ